MKIRFRVENSLPISHPSLPVKGGIPFPRGAVRPEDSFTVLDSSGTVAPAQVNVTGFWPDGSVKWVLVMMTAPVVSQGRTEYVLEVGAPSAAPVGNRITVRETEESIHVNTGKIEFTVSKASANLLESVLLVADGRAVPMLTKEHAAVLFVNVMRGDPVRGKRIRFEASGNAAEFSATLEEAGSERAVICLRGVHVSDSGESFGNYKVRIYAQAGSSVLRFVHSFVYTGDPQQDFVRSIGIRIKASFDKMECYRLGAERGSGVRTGHNLDPRYPIWQRAVLSQDSCLHYSMRKWVDPERNRAVTIWEGGRSQGWGSLSSGDATVTVGIRNFWQECPKAIEVNPLDGEVIGYLYSPYGEPLDFRRYSDLIYRSLYEAPSVRDALPIPFDQKLGAQYIGKTSEFFLDFAPGEEGDRSAREALFFQAPPLLTPGGEWIAATRAFGDFATAGQVDHPIATGRIKALSDFLRHEQEYRKWYSFIDYGDIMHSFDHYRDSWRFDVGGYAWLNNEFMMCEAMWHVFFHTGDEEVFRFAEAMTRHTGDVDMYHLGPLAGHGIRHNVNHWGCADKERRMTVPMNKRYYYFLTGDEHTRDLVHLIYDTICEEPPRKEAMDVGVGGYALLFLWETTGDPRYGEILQNVTETYCSKRVLGRGFAEYVDLDFRTGMGEVPDDTKAEAGWFLMAFGPMHILLDSVELTGSEKVRATLLDWADLLHLPQEELSKYQPHIAAGKAGHTTYMRVTSYAYRQTRDERYLEYIRSGLETPDVAPETVGGPSPLEAEEHPVYRRVRDPKDWRLCEFIMPELGHIPFGLGVVRDCG